MGPLEGIRVLDFTVYQQGPQASLVLGYDDMRKVNERIIYGHASGWGTKGPRASHPAFDLAAQAQGGLVSVTGEQDGYPLPAGCAVADYVGAAHPAMAVISAA